jgi:ribosomal protein S18 acetylase RimI-like enzyme
VTVPAEANALDEVVEVHQQAFPRFFMTQLGRRFLREYYRSVLEYPHGILLTEREGGACVGFVAGFGDPGAFYRQLRRCWARLGWAALAGLVARPARAITLIYNYRRTRDGARRLSGPTTAELSSLAVVPGAAGQGVGSRLARAFIETAAAHGVDRVGLTTDTHGNDDVNRFYQRLGFVCTRTFEARPGRWLNEYAFDIRRE